MADRNDKVLMAVGASVVAVSRFQFVQGFLDDNLPQDDGTAAGTITAPPSSAPAGSKANRNDKVMMVSGGRRVAVDRAAFVAFLNDTATQDDGIAAGQLVLPPTAQPAGTYIVNRNDKVLLSSGGQVTAVDRATFINFLNDNVAQDDGTAAATITLPATGMAFDGASTTGQSPTLTNSNRTASFTLDGTASTVVAAVFSTMTKSTGKWFIEFSIGAFGDGTANQYMTLGVAGSTADVNNLPGTYVDFFFIQACGAYAHYFFGSGAGMVVATGPAPAVNARVGFYFDADAHTFGIVTPDNVQQNSATALPTSEAFRVQLTGFTQAGIGTFAATIETTPTLTYPGGYLNAAA